MPKFMGIHTFPKNAFSQQQLNQFAQAAQQDPKVKGYRSFVNLAEGKAVCVMEAPDQQSVANWFEKMTTPCDGIVRVALEGDRGNVRTV